MDGSKGKEILGRFTQAEKRKTNWAETYREAQEYAAPQRETFDEEFPGQEKTESQKVFDATAQDAVIRFASNLQSSLVPPMREWIKLKAGSGVKLDKRGEQNLAEVQDKLFSNLQSSNFDTQVSESFLDLAFGTGALLVFEGDQERPFNFVNVPLSQLFLEEGAHGRVDTAFRRFKIAARVIDKQWPDAKLTEELNELIKESPDNQVEFIEATIPEKVEIFLPKENRTVKVDGYKYYVIEKGTSHVLVERSMKTSPWIIFRWANLPGEIYGRGVVLTALPAIRTLNKQVQLLLESASINTVGMYTAVDDGVVNLENIELKAGGIITVTSNGGNLQGPTLAPLKPSGQVELGQLIIKDQKAQINSIMFGDPLGDINTSVRTATEISLRQQDLARRIGSAFGKLQFEFISPLINRLLDILDTLGIIELGDFRVDGTRLAIEHISPLAQAQDEDDIQRMQRFAETLTGLFGPELSAQVIKSNEFAEALAKKLNISSDIVRSEEEIRQILQQLAQAQQQLPPQ